MVETWFLSRQSFFWVSVVKTDRLTQLQSTFWAGVSLSGAVLIAQESASQEEMPPP